jgi:Family of unknown function (DUF5715)
MRPTAHTIAVMSLACVLLSQNSLLAKPIRPVAANSSRRFLVAVPTSRKVTRAHTLSMPVATHAIAAHRPAKSMDKSAHAPMHATATTRSAKKLQASNSVEVHAQAAYAARNSATQDRVHTWELTHRNPPVTHTVVDNTDEATIDRVHAWELTHRNPPATHADIDNTDTATKPTALAESGDIATQPLLADNSNLVRTISELPRIKSIEEEASTPVLLQSLYDERGKLVVPPPLYGSHEVLLHQNQMADHEGLTRVHDDADLLDLRRDKKLVALPANETLRIDYRLPANRRFSRPWTADFLVVLARDFYASFHEPLMVDSAVRTVQVQRRLLRTNGNAAPVSGETASPHLTGQAVDIAKGSLTLPEIAWMCTYLAPLIEQGKIDVEEEFQQSCFHISVYRSYLPPTPAHVNVAAARTPDPGY